MPTLPTRAQQPAPVSAQVPLPPEFPTVPQSIIDRFPDAADWQARLKDFWNRASQAIQTSQQQAASYANARVVYTVDSFLIYVNGVPTPMFAVDDTGVRLGNVLVVNTPERKVYIGAGVYQDADTPFYIDTLGRFSLGANLSWDPDTSTLNITGTINATSGTIGGFTIGADYIRDTGNSMGLASTVTGGDDVRFWAGDTFANRGSAPLRITESGALVATSATISGTITSTSGTIGGFTLGASMLSAGSGDTYIALNATGALGYGLTMGVQTGTSLNVVTDHTGYYLREGSVSLAEIVSTGSAGSRGGFIELFDSSGTANVILNGKIGRGNFLTIAVGTYAGSPALSSGDGYFNGNLYGGGVGASTLYDFKIETNPDDADHCRIGAKFTAGSDGYDYWELDINGGGSKWVRFYSAVP